MNLVCRLPRYAQDSPQVTELERVIGRQGEAMQESREEVLAQLWVETATWGLDLWEQWVGLPTDRSQPREVRRSRVKAKLRGQGTTTVEMLSSVVASFGYRREQVTIVEHPKEYRFEIRLSQLTALPERLGDLENAVNEVKPAHLDYWFTYELLTLLTKMRVGGGFWSIQEVTLPLELGDCLITLQVGGGFCAMQEARLPNGGK